MRRLLSALFLLWPLALPAETVDPAQTARDRSYLTGLIEDNLSAEGRQIRLEGFRGALSSTAQFDELSISDAQGVWLSLRNGTLAWDRGALLGGRISVQTLSAEEILLDRLPLPAEQPVAAEAHPFALPELPVSVEIGSITAQKLRLGAPVLGQEVTLRLDGALRLAGGEGEARLALERTDGKRGQVALKASYANATGQTLLDLLVSEAAGGIAAGLLGLPGQPSLTLSASGTGPIDDFTTDILLGTDGAARLTGKVVLRNAAPAGSGEKQRSFTADLAGDVTPLLPTDYRAFFGNRSSLKAEGRRSASGMLSLSALSLSAQALSLSGSVDLLPSGLPERFALKADLGLANGQPVLLPLSGPETTLRKASLRLEYDRASGEGWRLHGQAFGFAREGNSFDQVTLDGSGRIGTGAQASATVGGTVDARITGIALSEPALGEAIGPFLAAKTRFFWQEGQPLNLPDLRLSAQDLTLSGRLTLDNLAQGIDLAGQLEAQHRGLARLSNLAGRSLSGAANAQLAGRYTLLTGAFDGTAQVEAQDLTLDQPQVDALLAGVANLSLDARRDETGLDLRRFSANGAGLTLSAKGRLSRRESALKASFTLPQLARLGPGYGGALSAQAELTGAEGARQLSLSGEGKGLAVAQPELSRILAQESRFSARIAETEGAFRLQDLAFSTPQFQAQAQVRKGSLGKSHEVSARLANTALIAPGFPGPLAVSGRVDDAGTGFALDLHATGPGGTEAKLQGTLQKTLSSADLTLSGRSETALANAFIAPQSVQGPLVFSFALRGKPELAALSGSLSGTNLRISAPTANLRLEDIGLRVALSRGVAQIDTQGRFADGGTLALSGPLRLASLGAEFALVLDRARLRNPELYDTRISGRLALSGPLAGGARVSGALTLDETELRIPSGGLSGAAAIPDITHLAEPAAVHQTRVRAGLIESATAGAGPKTAIGLDVSVSAPRQIFVRGRGLDAELGGALRLTGSTAAIVPVGEFSLVRGRLDVLGKRFTLTEGQVALQGALEPWILFSATTTQDEIAIKLSLEGNASAPVLTVTSAPELPEEEVLARLLFNKGLSNLSPLQAAQLATAVASLAGKGGEGIVSRLRQGFGLDDLDVGTDESGNATVRAGKYLAENVYTDVAVDSAGKAEVTLNLDLTPQVTARGAVDSTGQSSLGLFFEKDY